MPLSAFNYLLEELCESITVSCLKSMCSTSGNEPIYPEVIVVVGLGFLEVGDTHSSLPDTYGMSDASAYHIVDMFLDAVDYNELCKALRVELPRSDSELNEVAQRWRDVLTCPINMLNVHIGAIDGWFIQTEMPHDQTNQADYCSGHYQSYGLNVQAICDPALSPLINLETQHDGRSAPIWMKKVYYFYVVVKGQKGFAREHQNGFYET
jgi:hypothetical protein